MPPLEVLYKIRRQRPDIFEKMEGRAMLHPTSISKLTSASKCLLTEVLPEVAVRSDYRWPQ